MRLVLASVLIFWSFSVFANVSKIGSDEFDQLANFSNFRSSYVKFVIFVNDKNLSIEFFDSKKTDLHVDYLKNVKGIKTPVEEIYRQARLNAGRKYFFGALIKSELFVNNSVFNDTEVQFSFQITAEDPLSVEDLIHIGKTVKNSTQLEAQLYYMPSGNQAQYISGQKEQNQLATAGFAISKANTKDMQVYYEASSVGRLKKVLAKDIETGAYLVRGDEILLLDYVPDSLPPVRGVITSQPTSPNSHVSLLANMYSIPFLYIKNASMLSNLMALDGSSILLKSQNEDYIIQKLDAEMYTHLEQQWLKKFPQVSINLDQSKLQKLNWFPKIGNTTDELSVDSCGAKATNGSLLAKVLGTQNSIEGFCIPFAYFHKFMTTNKVGNETLRNYILSRINKISYQTPLEEVQAILADIKEQIEVATIDTQDIQSIKAAIIEAYASKKHIEKIRFRSSSNAEDDERFNGAGLYESDGLKLKHVYESNDKKVVESLKIVWSSLYGLRAVLARKMFHIDESKVYMGILINQAFAETANGVSLCSYPYVGADFQCNIEGFPGGELSVAHPVAGKMSEILSVNKNENFPGGVDYNVAQYTSELGQFETIMNDEELGELFTLQEKVHTYWAQTKKPGFTGQLDFEWKRMQDSSGKTYMAVKQVREVPQKLVFAAKEPMLLIPQDTEFQTGWVENSATLASLFSMRKIRISIPSFTPMKDTKTLRESTQIHASDFKVQNLKLDITDVTYNEEAWMWNEYENRNERVVSVIFKVQHPAFSGFEIKISYKQTKYQETFGMDNIVDVKNMTLSTVLSAQDVFGAQAKTKDSIETYLEQGIHTIIVPKKKENFCIHQKIVATSTFTEVAVGLYNDGTSNMDSIWIDKTIFKKLKNDIQIKDKKSLVSMNDSHAFEEGLYMTVNSIYMSPESAKAAGLLEEEHYIVIAQGSNAYGSEDSTPPENKIILFDKNKNVVESRKLSDCPQ